MKFRKAVKHLDQSMVSLVFELKDSKDFTLLALADFAYFMWADLGPGLVDMSPADRIETVASMQATVDSMLVKHAENEAALT